ncbi:MAG: class III extradiol ring-cleavage dioxygenase, partial [Gammaproteobacteria bacterium]|nr:class III extradiol ring-cleavage dioxygenase [Gammaproteobacteria bacterium]
LFIPHGGGPLPLLGEPGHKNMINFLTSLAATLPRPDAIIVISAHWEESQPTITSAASPALIYDYYGFPEESYQIQYPAPGEPELAKKMATLLSEHGFQPKLDAERGFDHGMFVPLKLMFPEANIPCVQLSLLNTMDAQQHIKLGEALSTLREENIMVLGSGFSFHNLRAMMSGQLDSEKNQAFENWLINTCTDEAAAESERVSKLAQWEQAPAARYCHPREEHLLPLQVCYGMAQSPAELIFNDNIFGVLSSGFLWRA